MEFDVVIKTDAELEILEAVVWYDSKRPGLGNELILCLESGLEILKRNPYFEIRHNQNRILNIKRFPYQVVYYVEGNTIYVTSFFHANRDPEIWQSK